MRWEAPPLGGKLRRADSIALDEMAMEIRSRPMKWALLGEGLSKNGLRSIERSCKRRGLRVVQRIASDRTYSVYARYEPPESEAT